MALGTKESQLVHGVDVRNTESVKISRILYLISETGGEVEVSRWGIRYWVNIGVIYQNKTTCTLAVGRR